MRSMMVTQECPTLVADRILLKPIQVNDAEDLFSLWSEGSTSELAGIEKPNNKESIAAGLEYFQLMNESGFFLKWSIREKISDTFMGEIELYPLKPQIQPWHEWAIGYSLKEKVRGKGFMSEAVRRVLCFAFIEKSAYRIKADVPEKNVKSLKLLRNNGFSCEGVQSNKLLLNGTFKNMSQLAITRARFFEGTNTKNQFIRI